MLSSISFNYLSNTDFVTLTLVSFFSPFKIYTIVSFKEIFKEAIMFNKIFTIYSYFYLQHIGNQLYPMPSRNSIAARFPLENRS